MHLLSVILWNDEVPNSVTLCLIAFGNKSLYGVEWQYSNIEWGSTWHINLLENFHHYCFAKEVCIITDYRPLVTMVNKDVRMLSK